ncbi:MAG: phosphohistidine phosphatase SixA [Desulfatitalea sp.]|nr:phosphohistidine phosphatase SixA [Desulfatitalea sp.]
MALYLVQHGKSRPKTEDPLQGLTEQGADAVRRVADVAANYRVRVSTILHSGKERAARSADILAAALHPPGGVRQIEGIGPMDDVAAFARNVKMDQDEMIVGHLPFLERLMAHLVVGSSERPIFQMQNGGIVCLDHYPDSTRPVIRWALMPHVG